MNLQRWLALILLSSFALNARAEPPFPLVPVLEAAFGETTGRWAPDWPPEIPPDAFTVKGEASNITLTGPAIQYRLARDLTDFPIALYTGENDQTYGGVIFAQAEVRYDAGGGVAALTLHVPAVEDTPISAWTAQFPVPYRPGMSLSRPDEAVKVQNGSQVYYVLLSEGGDGIAETWFDPWGEFAAYFSTRLERRSGVGMGYLRSVEGTASTEYHYESGGNISESFGSRGRFSAVYGAWGQPLYLVRAPSLQQDALQPPIPRHYSFQWDQEHRLVRMLDTTPAPDKEAGIVLSPGPGEAGILAAKVHPPVDFRYEYEYDARGNWILRREIALYREGDLLLPASTREIVRHIQYARED